MTLSQRRHLGIVALFMFLTHLPFLGKAYHIDEPHFLMIARHILEDPLHPTRFAANWYGTVVPMERISPNPPLTHYMLAVGLKLTGGSEWAMRLFFLPVDLLSAIALYLLAARFLSSPLLPTLIVLACPAYFINMQHLMAEKWMGAFGFWCLYALVYGLDTRRPAWWWASAGLLAAALMCKYNSVFLIPIVVAYSMHRGLPPRRIAAYLGLALAPAGLYALSDILRAGGSIGTAVDMIHRGASAPWSNLSNKARSFLAFAGGSGGIIAAWPYMRERRGGLRAMAFGFCAAVLLFLPALDLDKVRSLDRWTGILFSSSALLGFVALLRSPRRIPGWALWFPWAAAAAALQLCVYWSVSTRYILPIIPPLVFILAARFESIWIARYLRRFYAASLACQLGLTFCLAAVDQRYAAAQKTLAQEVAKQYISQGRRVYFTGHWGLQYYLEQAGAVALDSGRGGWDVVRPGEIVVVPRMNTNLVVPKRRIFSNARWITVEYPIPLRLMSAIPGFQAGFYSNVFGFLPFALDREPLEEFCLVERQ